MHDVLTHIRSIFRSITLVHYLERLYGPLNKTILLISRECVKRLGARGHHGSHHYVRQALASAARYRAVMASDTELVVLLNDDGIPIGSAFKAEVHDVNTPLHLAFSCHIFDKEGQILITRRALTKIAWPGVWTNSVCGHPAPGEDVEDAISRRAKRELGIRLTELELVLPDFRYRAVDASGIVENEVCPVFRAISTDTVAPAPDEVAEWRWVAPHALRTAVTATPFAFSPWLVLQLDAWDPAGS